MKFYARSDADPIHIRLKEDQTYKLEIDFSQWAEENGAITSTSASVRSGQVTAGTPTVSSNVVTMSLTQAQEGTSRVELKVINATYTGIQNIFVKYIDRDATLQHDYGILS